MIVTRFAAIYGGSVDDIDAAGYLRGSHFFARRGQRVLTYYAQ